MSSASQQALSLLETLFEQTVVESNEMFPSHVPQETHQASDHDRMESSSAVYGSPTTDNPRINISALSLDSSDAQQLMHCYQLALNYGVPTARRALAMYQAGLIQTPEEDSNH